jgi:hypothetical protein
MQETNAWEGSRLLFSISPAENGSALEFKQTGYKQSPCHKVCTAGWHFVLGKSLKAYLETGKGMPYESKMM